MTVKAQPAGYHSLTPYLIVKDASGAIEFYTKVFGAKEQFRISGPDGKIGHAELKIGDSVVMLADESPRERCAAYNWRVAGADPSLRRQRRRRGRASRRLGEKTRPSSRRSVLRRPHWRD